MSAQPVKARLLAAARPRLKDLKYRLLGLPAPARTPHQYVPPATWTETDTLQYLKQTRVLAQSAIALLARATDLGAALPARPPIRAELRRPAAVEPLLRADADLRQCLVPLTAYDYGAMYTQRITNFLLRRLRPDHALELTPDMYNRAIGYFLAVNDVHMARLLFEQMQLRRVRPNTATVNLLLASQARRITANPYPLEQLGHPLLMTVSLLRRLEPLEIKASAETWNMVLQCMPFGFGKSFLVEEMDRRGIALNATSQQACLETIVSEHGSARKGGGDGGGGGGGGGGISPRIYEAVLGSLDLENPIMLRLIVDRALAQKQPANGNVESALGLLRRTASAGRDTALLNVFLRRFANRKHLDWQFGVLGEFGAAAWDPKTWEYFIAGASRLFYTQPQRYVVIGSVLKQAEREDVPLTPQARVHARRAIREAARRGRTLLDVGPAGWDALKENLKWTPGTMRPQNAAFLACIGFAGPEAGPGAGPEAGAGLAASPACLDESRFEALAPTGSAVRPAALQDALQDALKAVARNERL